MSDAKIIVLTPVKNEDWILKQFLETTSLFADYIIIANQNSTDRSVEICRQFSKVFLINNNSNDYNEAKRQNLLIETARTLFPNNKRVLIALDADEIFSADSLHLTLSWQKIKLLEPGTTIYLEKPDILPGVKRCVRYRDNYFSIGYVDDNIKHNAIAIHSKRVPQHPNKLPVYINDIKVLHFAHSRQNVQSSKLRYYSVFENINNINPTYLRRHLYKCTYNENKFYAKRNLEAIPVEWIKGWDKKNIDLRHFPDPKYSWYDYEVLRNFKKFGTSKFYLDNIWCVDWEDCKKIALQQNLDAPDKKISYPPLLKKIYGEIIDTSYLFYNRFKRLTNSEHRN